MATVNANLFIIDKFRVPNFDLIFLEVDFHQLFSSFQIFVTQPIHVLAKIDAKFLLQKLHNGMLWHALGGAIIFLSLQHLIAPALDLTYLFVFPM